MVYMIFAHIPLTKASHMVIPPNGPVRSIPSMCEHNKGEEWIILLQGRDMLKYFSA